MTVSTTIHIRVAKHDDGYWSAVEPEGDAPAGRGETRHDAVAAYVENARQVARQKSNRNNRRNPEQSKKIGRAIGRISGRVDADNAQTRTGVSTAEGTNNDEKTHTNTEDH